MLCELKRFRAVIWILIILLLWHYGGGLTYAQNRARGQISPGTPTVARGAAPPAAPEELRFDTLLSELKEALQQEGKASLPQEGQAISAAKTPVDLGKLGDLKARLVQENDKVQAYFSELENFIKQKGLSEEILNRHLEFVRDYEAKYATLMTNLEGVESAQEAPTGFWAGTVHRLRQAMTGAVDREEVVTQTLGFLEANTPRPRKSHFDPHNLPHRTLKADKPIPPKLTPEEWRKAFPQEAGGTGPVSSLLSIATAEAAPTSAPTPADLAETIEVQFTPEIRQLAESLNNNPVKIFNWVRNNIEFVPTWGSIQGAQLCMETRAGNAFDTASLLIALLRVSGIPARYQIGTIEVPIEEAMNWLGGFTDARAAARFAASGGIPSAGTVEQGGVLRSIHMEHVWVIAYVDYIPSQGAVQIEGDTWVSLDSSFKLYNRFPGEDLASKLDFDVTPVVEHLDNTTSFGATDGSISNIDTAFIDRTYQELTNKLKLAFPSGDPKPAFPPPTVRRRELSIVPTALPYRVLLQGPTVQTLPPSLRHSITLWLSDDLGNRLMEFQAALPEIADKPVSLFYEPATQADINLIRAAVPADFLSDNRPGTLVQRAMQRIPAQLITLRPVIQVNGETTVSGTPVGMGRRLTLNAHFDAPTITTPISTLSTISWGRYGITLDLAGIPSDALRNKITRYQDLVRQLQSTDKAGLVANIPHEMVVLLWFNQVDDLSQLLGRAAGVAFARYPSLGFSYPPQSVTQIFGVPLKVDIEDFAIDIARQFQVFSALSGNPDLEAAYNLQVGFLSSLLEGQVVAKFFNGSTSRLTGISTSSALYAAAQQSIPIHLLHSSNFETVLPLLEDSYDKNSIRAWINAGRGVLLARQPPRVDGRQVFGYAAIDLTTGDGAFIVNDARAGWVRAVCPDTATEFEQCASWLVIFIDILFIVSASILIAFALDALALALISLSAIIVAMLPPTAFGIVLVGGFGFLSIIGCADAIIRVNPLSCVKDLLRFIYLWQNGVPAPF